MFSELLRKNHYLGQLIYAIILVVLIPSALVVNTIYLLNSFKRDMDYELNNKALLVQSVISMNVSDSLDNNTDLKAMLDSIVTELPDIRAIEVFKLKDQETLSFTSTSSLTRAVYDPVLNHLAFSTDSVYSKQINAAIGEQEAERIWLVAAPMYDTSHNKIGVINTYISAAQIDAIMQRTIYDSLKVLLITLVVILLLLINHFSLFERAIAFVKLKEIDDLKDDFISIAAHELKTPLTIISSYAFLLTKNKDLTQHPEMQDELAKIIASSNRLKVLVNDILDVTRIEMNKMVFEKKQQELQSILKSVVDQLAPEAQKKGLTLQYMLPAQSVIVMGDKNKLEQIFINLVGNAVKYTEKGSIIIAHEIEKGMVKTYIKDTGIGIPPDKIERLFNKFSRISNDKTAGIPGTGLGLWITKQLIEKMNGKIYVESIENTGTQFSVIFPLSS